MFFGKSAIVEDGKLVFEVRHDDGTFRVEVAHPCLVRYYGSSKELKADFYNENIENFKYSVRRAFHKKNLKYIKKAEPIPSILPHLRVTISVEKWISYLNEDGRLTESGTITVTFWDHKKPTIIEIDTLAEKSHLAAVASQLDNQ